MEEALPVRYRSGTTFITTAPPVSPTETPWGVDRENFRGIVESGQDHLIIVYKADQWALTNLVNRQASKRITGQVGQILEYMGSELKFGSGTTSLKTPEMLRVRGYKFREVINSKALWESWGSHDNPLKVIIFSDREEAEAINGFVTYQVA